LIDNITFVLTNLTGINNNSDFIWEQQWTYDPEEAPKLKHTITNNLGKITNVTYWFVFKLPKNYKVKFGGTDYNTANDIGVINTGEINLTSVLPIIDLGMVEFRYADLLKTDFVITDFYVGNGSMIGHPETFIAAIGVTKGNSVLKNKEMITLDPEITDWKSPTRTGQFYSTI